MDLYNYSLAVRYFLRFEIKKIDFSKCKIDESSPSLRNEEKFTDGSLTLRKVKIQLTLFFFIW